MTFYHSAVYSPTVGYPFVHTSRADVLQAWEELRVEFPDARIYEVRPWSVGGSRDPGTNAESGGVGGIWKDANDTPIVLAKDVTPCAASVWGCFGTPKGDACGLCGCKVPTSGRV